MIGVCNDSFEFCNSIYQVTSHFWQIVQTITSLQMYIIRNSSLRLNQISKHFSPTHNQLDMQNEELESNFELSCLTVIKQKKRYNKVNEEIRKQFLRLIIQQNMTIKNASQILNINYSSAKVVLANHRKNFSLRCRSVHLHVGQAHYDALNLFDAQLNSIELVCSTGGKEVIHHKSSGSIKSIGSPNIIITGPRKDHESFEHTYSLPSSET